MREIRHNFDITKDRIVRLQGLKLNIVVNRGRNRLVEYTGMIQDIYPNIFTVKITSEYIPLQSFSYSDVMTKNIRFFQDEK